MWKHITSVHACVSACVRACVRASERAYDVRNYRGNGDSVRCAYFLGEGSVLLLFTLLLSSV